MPEVWMSAIEGAQCYWTVCQIISLRTFALFFSSWQRIVPRLIISKSGSKWMPCVKLQPTMCEGSPATQPFDCSGATRTEGWGVEERGWGGHFPLVGQTVITDPRYLMSGASRWELSREKTHSAGLSHSACVCEREGERRGRKYETRDIGAHVKAWVRVGCVHVFSVSAKVCAPMFLVCVSRWPKYSHIPKPWDWHWPHLWRAPVNSLQVMMVVVWSKTETGLAFGLLVQL